MPYGVNPKTGLPGPAPKPARDGESGPKRRETKLEWVRSLRDQCRAAGVAFFVKQLEIDGKVTDDISRFPVDLQIQEFPKSEHRQQESEAERQS